MLAAALLLGVATFAGVLLALLRSRPAPPPPSDLSLALDRAGRAMVELGTEIGATLTPAVSRAIAGFQQFGDAYRRR